MEEATPAGNSIPRTRITQQPKPEYKASPPKYLSPEHRKMLFEESGIAPSVAAERGYETVKSRAALSEFSKKQRRASVSAPALRVPMYSPDGITRLSQIRPHTPRSPGLKYETPQGADLIVDVHPRMRDRIRHGDEPFLITEGAKTGDSATSRGIPTVVLAGVWGWCERGVRPYKLRSDFDHIRLDRSVLIGFDSDCMTQENVQRALAALVPVLEERGADVWVAYLPDAPDGSKQGIDDFFATGGTVEELWSLARKFDPADIVEIRLSRDDKHRSSIEYLWDDWHSRDWRHFAGKPKVDAVGEVHKAKPNWRRGYSARDAKEGLIRLAMKYGKLDSGGVMVEVGLRHLGDLAAKSRTSAGSAVAHLEADGQIDIIEPDSKDKPRRYRLKVPAHILDTMGGGYEERESQEGESNREREERDRGVSRFRAPTAPRLRWSSPKGRRRKEFETVEGRGVVRATGARTPDEQEITLGIKRLCPHRGAAIDALWDTGCVEGAKMAEGALMDALHYTGRARDFRRRTLKDIAESEIVECEGGRVGLTRDWREKLDERRDRDGEIRQNKIQAKKYKDESKEYREHLERKRRGTPQASMDAARRTKEKRERRMREMREEEKRDQEPTPPAVERLVKRLMGQNARIRMELLCEIAMDEGLRWRDVPPAVRRMGYRIERLPEFGDAEFIYSDREAA